MTKRDGQAKPDRDEPVSLHGLTPEEALRALMQVDPDDPPADQGAPDDVSGNDEAPER